MISEKMSKTNMPKKHNEDKFVANRKGFNTFFFVNLYKVPQKYLDTTN